MHRTSGELAHILSLRAGATPCVPPSYYDCASEIIVFGSMAVGLDGPKSDIDVLCIGGEEHKVKTPSLDLLVVGQDALSNQDWLHSELASHVSRYGVWIKGVPQWLSDAGVGSKAVLEKRRRVAAFMTYLPEYWPRLDSRFRRKYAIKVRRETQRLLLLEGGMPVPPTKLLDSSWSSFMHTLDDVFDRLTLFASFTHRDFMNEFLVQVIEHFPSARITEGEVK